METVKLSIIKKYNLIYDSPQVKIYENDWTCYMVQDKKIKVYYDIDQCLSDATLLTNRAKKN